MFTQRYLLENKMTEILGKPLLYSDTFMTWSTDAWEITIATYSKHFNHLWTIFKHCKRQDKTQVLDKLDASQIIHEAKSFLDTQA